MHTQTDGGPAFPQSVSGGGGPQASYDFEDGAGMTLRDYFAAQALVLFSSKESIAATYAAYKDDAVEAIANSAYEMADALLRAREAK